MLLGKWIVSAIAYPGPSEGPVYDHQNNCVAGVVIKSNMNVAKPLVVLVRPEGSNITMRALQAYAPESVREL